MNYELAKQLKDAGFPFEKRVEFAGIHDIDGFGTCCYCESTTFGEGNNAVLIPTLSELIDACGEELDEINIYITEELVEVHGVNPTYGHDIKTVGKTSEEAVARLWLALRG